MRISIKNNKPEVEDLPEGVKILFLGKINQFKGLCMIYGPPETCLPQGPNDPFELWDAKLAIGKDGEDMQVHDVKHGHKYHQGGGFVETEHGGQVFFRLKNDDRSSNYEGGEFETVYIAL